MSSRVAILLLVLAIFARPGLSQNRVVIRGGTIINVVDGSLIPDAVLVLEGDRVASVSRAANDAASGDVEIDATGKYVIPGFIDSHVHLREWSMELYLNHGVTTVLNMGSPPEWVRAQQKAADTGTLLGPRVIYGSYNFIGPLNGPNGFVRGHQKVLERPEEAAPAVNGALRSGASYIKTQAGVTLEMARALVQEAKKANLPVIGHFSEGANIALQAGADAITHFGAVSSDLVDHQAQQAALKNVRRGFRPPASAFMDFDKATMLVRDMVRSGMYFNPTVRIGWGGQKILRDKGFPNEDFDLLINNWDLRYVPLQFKMVDFKEYQQVGEWHWSDLSPVELELYEQAFVNEQRFLKMFADAGGKLMSGVDTPSASVPGIALHQEMELLVDSGVSPLQVLQATTVNPAAFVRKLDKLGSLEEGKVGDVVILEGNPLEDIRNTRRIFQVISRGRVLDGKYHADFFNPYPYPAAEHSSHYFPSPRIRSAAPDTVQAGQRNGTVTISGTGFIPYSLVRFNGHVLKPEFVEDRQLIVRIPSDLLQPGTFALVVENPDFAWGTTNARGAGDIAHLGIRGPVSNEFLLHVYASD